MKRQLSSILIRHPGAAGAVLAMMAGLLFRCSPLGDGLATLSFHISSFLSGTDRLARFSYWSELFALAALGAVLGAGLTRFRPKAATRLALLSAGVIMLLSWIMV